MSHKNKNDGYPGDDCMAEYWARALGVSTKRLMALVKEVAAERGNIRDARRPTAQPVE